uniref:Uncharacterized protein n=1 Tax=Gadus morhua TaxID=8049 RepID=A0A8C5AC52_GADMO
MATIVNVNYSPVSPGPGPRCRPQRGQLSSSHQSTICGSAELANTSNPGPLRLTVMYHSTRHNPPPLTAEGRGGGTPPPHTWNQ